MNTLAPDAQFLHVYDKVKNVDLYFDGVIKASHTLQLQIEDDPSNIKKSKHVNNAIDGATELSVDVVMSNVYTSGGSLAGSTGDRIKNAFQYLSQIKENRQLVEVITTLCTYDNMLIKSISITQDENTGLESWQGTIVFHEKLEKNKNNTKSSSGSKNDTTIGKPQQSVIAGLVNG